MSQYLILIYDNESTWANADDSLQGTILAGHMAFGEKNAAAVAGGNALQSTTTATSIRSDGSGDFTITDGPFVETKEALGGYYLIEAADLDEAISFAAMIPGAKHGCIEVRPVWDYGAAAASGAQEPAAAAAN